MDGFLRRQLFAQDVAVLLSQPPDEALRALVEIHGGVVIDLQDATQDARVNVALTDDKDPDQDEMRRLQTLLSSRFPRAQVLNAQWARDSVKKNRRLSLSSFQVSALQPVEAAEPPAKKLKVASSTSSAGFFSAAGDDGAAAQLPKPHLTPWRTVHGSLYVLDARAKEQQQQQEMEKNKIKVAGFDLDGTLIVTKSGKKFAKDKDDWKWFHPTLVRDKLAQLARDGFTLVIFSNQNGIAKGHITAAQVQSKLETIVKQLKLPMLVLLGTENDAMRKPRLGAWKEMVNVLSSEGDGAVDKEASFYCGDAAGRPKIAGRGKDFAATDYKFALNAGIRFFTPEDLFLCTKQRLHTRPDTWELGFDPKSIALNESNEPVLSPASAQTAKSDQEIVVLVGPPASGKSFFAKTYLGSYTIVSQDELRTTANCKKKCLEAIVHKKSVVIDNTNREPRARKEWMFIAQEKNLPIRCFEMDVPKPLSMHLNTFRSLTEQKKIPDVAIHGFYKNFVPPTVNEGFAEVCVRFRRSGEQPKEGTRERTQVMSSKIKDGLFMGDMDAAQDADFLQLNGIMHIVNCVPRQVPNIFQQSLGLSYTACDLDEVLRRPFFDLKNREFTHIIQIIDRALERTESVLVHSLNGINRSPSIMIGYLMVKYCWGLDKAHEFVMTKRSDMKLHESYIDQLCSLEAQIQEDRPARATERQLYEWSMHTMDPKTDEVVLIHTFLNTASAPDADATSSRRNESTRRHRERRLTWIDQTPEMRKLHPSLLVRPERPPNHSYSKMTAANGWVDLLDPSPALAHQAKIKEMAAEAGLLATRVAFADLSTSKYLDPSGPEFDLSVPSAAEVPLVHSSKRLHSFSAPKRTEILDDEASTSPSTISEELDLMPEEATNSSNPRYLRETLASINSRPRRLSSTNCAASSFRSSATTSTKRVSLPASGRSFSSGAILGSTGSKDKAPTATSKGVAKRTGKPVTGPGSRAASSTAPGGRVFFSVDFPPPQSSTASLSSRGRGGHILTGSTRRSVAEPLSQQAQTSAPTRPRTAPPRGRKDVETKDLLQSKKVELGGFSRITIDPKSSFRMHSSTDYATMDDANPATSSSTSRGVRRTSTSTTSGYGRAKTARASWR
ncbi:hypothetical protein PF005_g16674 [Phytophthora fragariae]|uniref:Tyrosine-protein phosphatase domain-containing protein n=1 Tax=Phytophthora fragariae TaxID=53985 RepID=A0A6A3LGF5_9STRA|nr:hypothetical protein PF003_g35703 [Phytophthora fragariae]KAE8944133.1 hypothetical protein PF009_g6183 [Phytophthora fragariae]KAE9017650.1 hypothetical protein PF011_g6611 [Phytophthora fragariae]KAE9096989.1 hypothetical protein PF010_g16131 [Phytophthora fragariae]KAE9109410.1 hypothetical protein PF007_g12248 [Phytophthora fragariae]